MINVSSEFKQLMEQRTDFKENAEITLSDGTVLTLAEKDFCISGNSIVDGAGSSSFPLGVAVQKYAELELDNHDDHLADYDFFGAKVRLYLTFELSSAIEKIEYCTFTVVEPETYGSTVIIKAVDDMYKADKPYATKLTYPQSLASILDDSCTTCGIELGTLTFPNSNFVIQKEPSGDYTHRQVIGWIAMLAGGNARINRFGKLNIISYDFSFPDDTPVLKNFKSLKTGTSDIEITGVKTSVKGGANESDIEYSCGTEGYVISIQNLLIEGIEQSAVNLIGDALIGARFRNFEGDHVAYPIAEFMDLVYIKDRKGNVYQSVLTDIDFTFFGFTVMKNSSTAPARNSSKYSSDAAQAYVNARKLVEAERTARETALQNLADRLASSSGLYMTPEKQPDGSTIYYMHDKPELSESGIVWKLAAEALGISTDGGKTYPYGLDVSGTAILNRIYTVGLNADYINSGSITAKDSDGNVVFFVNVETGQVYIDASQITMHSESMDTYIDGIKQTAENAKKASDKAVIASAEEYAVSADPTVVPDGEWYGVPPDYVEGMYIWRRQVTTYGDGSVVTGKAVLVTGNSGKNGEDAVLLRIDSSRGTVFKNDSVSTVLSVVIYYGDKRIADAAQMKQYFGQAAYLQWYWKRLDDDTFGIISASDKMLSDSGFHLSLSQETVDTKVSFRCELHF